MTAEPEHCMRENVYSGKSVNSVHIQIWKKHCPIILSIIFFNNFIFFGFIGV